MTNLSNTSILCKIQCLATAGKEVGKLLAAVFGTVEEKAAASMKPKGVKPGKGRRSGGYGIG